MVRQLVRGLKISSFDNKLKTLPELKHCFNILHFPHSYMKIYEKVFKAGL